MLRSADAPGDGPDTFIAAPAPGSAWRRRRGQAGTPEAVTELEETPAHIWGLYGVPGVGSHGTAFARGDLGAHERKSTPKALGSQILGRADPKELGMAREAPSPSR